MATASTERPTPRRTTLDDIPCFPAIPLDQLDGAVGSFITRRLDVPAEHGTDGGAAVA